mmetsp:Transcript_19031/g.60586  ORF Transcript_19031/g.60586 Transcript_19031/m.60586 type:complete len:312 (-) Transcript_19031:433-1368(-)
MISGFSLLVVVFFIMLPVVPLLYMYFNRSSSGKSSASQRNASGVARGVPHFAFAVADDRGRRPYMEDRWVVESRWKGLDTPVTLYGVFDGHGGHRASQFCVDHLPDNLFRDTQFPSDPRQALTNCFLNTDDQFLHVAKIGSLDDGTTAIVMLACGTRLYVANAGDSRCVLVQRSGDVVQLSEDHKPNRKDERERIQSRGGHVMFWGVWRTQGVLAVSRAIGDRMLKQYVTAEPEIEVYDLNPQDVFAVLASDGLWDVLQPADVGRLVREQTNADQAARMLRDLALRRNSTDNICVMVVDLRAPVAAGAASR